MSAKMKSGSLGGAASAVLRPRRGFTLIEVMIAMSIFLAAMLAISGLFFQNLRLARMAQEEIVVSMIQRDVMARNLVVAMARAGEERLYVRNNAGAVPSAFAKQFPNFGVPGDTNPGVLTKGWGIRNKDAWEASSGMHWGVSTPVAADTDVPLYNGFYFSVVPVVRHFPGGGTAADWAAVGNTPGLAMEDCQFTDWDGYGLVDMDGDGIPETDRGLPSPSPGPLMDATLASCNYQTSPFRIYYNSNNMSRYVMKVRVRVMWNVRNEDDVSLTDLQVRAKEDNHERVFNHNEYYFSVFNPDVVKRWQP
jgi:prepilin-type N-terminal cleavage/methylation domain-containing protein